MKRLFMAFVAATIAVFAGCKTVPTPEVLEATSRQIGVAAGYVANQMKIDDKTRAVVVTVMEEASAVLPEEGQSFEDAWTPVAEKVIAQFIAEGKLDEAQAVLVRAAFSAAVKGLDYLFDIRYPKARQYTDLVAAAVHGFTDGFLSVFNVAMRAAPAAYDAEAYNYISAAVKHTTK